MISKMTEYKEVLIACIIAISIGAIIGMMIGSSSVHSTWQLDAAGTTCAQFNPKNGQFEWIPEILEVPHRKSKID